MLIIKEDEKAEIMEDLKDEYFNMPQDQLYGKCCDLYLKNYVNESDADTLRTAAFEFLVMTHERGLEEGFPSDEDVEKQIEHWREDT